MSLAALAVPLTTDPGAVKQCFRGLAAGLRRVLIGWVHGHGLCYVDGRLQTRSWDDKDGKKQYITEVVAKEVVFLSRKEAKSGVQPARQQPPQRDDSAEDDSAEDDIPF